MSWRIITYRLPTEPSRNRVAAWRELRRVGAVPLQSATWAVPAGDQFDEGLEKARSIVDRAGGQVLVFDVTASEETSVLLEALYEAERDAEWKEFCSECEKARQELRGEFDKQKFTLAELDEEEQNIDRLRRWYRDLRAKDVFGSATTAEAERELKTCVEILEDYAERVYQERTRP
jgi:hypothetical protein